jgi:hypothetical protein
VTALSVSVSMICSSRWVVLLGSAAYPLSRLLNAP